MAARYWMMSGGASLVAHGALFAGLGLSLAPQPVEQQTVPKSELTVTSYQVDQSDAAAKTPEGEAAQEQEPAAPLLGSGAIARSKAVRSEVDADHLEQAAPPAQRLAAFQAPRQKQSATAPIGQAVEDVISAAPVLKSKALPSVAATSNSVTPQRLGTITAAPDAASSIAPSTEVAQNIPAPQNVITQIVATGTTGQTVEPQSDRVAASLTAPPKIVSTAAAMSKAAALSVPSAVQVPQSTPTSRVANLAKPQVAALDATAPKADLTRPSALDAFQPALANRPAQSAPQVEIAPDRVANQQVEAAPARAQDLPTEFATASLAWSGDQEGVVDPVSLAAIQAFMQPSDLGQGGAESEVRDGIEAVLASVPCARLQTEFDPTTGRLQLRGHIPEDGLRAPVLAALKAQIGNAIPIEDTLLILPRPQCGALSGIANVGLPQSTDQITNPRVVGPQGFARNFTYSAGQRLILELTAPDYPSVVYVDYFTADGQVLHLQPNSIVPLEAYRAQSAFTVGKDRGDKPSLNLTISPPFGQEIAVAFAASVPVYEGLRPINEPAEPYLAFLRAKIAELRENDPNFKGEWVYFFISAKAQ